MTTISVVIPTHNRAVLLQRTLDSALAQRDVHLEVLVVNDGSTDRTSQALAARRETRIRELRNDVPRYVSAARNRGIREASGEWVALLDDDDLWAPDKLTSQLAALDRSSAGWSYTGYVMVESQLNVLAGGSPPPEDVVHRRMPYEDVIAAGASSIVARRSLLHEVGLFDEPLTRLETRDLQIRLAEAAPAVGVAEPLVAYCQHQAQVSLDTSSLFDALDVIDRRYRPMRDGASLDRSQAHRWIGWSALRSGDRRSAARACVRALAAGDLSSGLRLAIGLISPRAARRLARIPFDASWGARADAWLEEYRELTPAAAPPARRA